MADYDPDAFFAAERKPRTNYDRIRDMSVEEMAEMISTYLDCAECRNMIGYKPCRNGECCPDFWRDWLKQEVSDDG